MILQVPKRDFSLRESADSENLLPFTIEGWDGVEWKYHNWRRKGWGGGTSESISSQSPLLWQPIVEKQFAIKKKKNLTEPQHKCLLLHKTARLRTTEEAPCALPLGLACIRLNSLHFQALLGLTQ